MPWNGPKSTGSCGNLRRKETPGALVRILLSRGLRVSEASSLLVFDLDLGERYGTVTVRYGKGNKYRDVSVPPEARKAL